MVNCDAPITVARMRCPGSTSGSLARVLSSLVSASASGMAISPNCCGSVAKIYSDTPPENVSATGSAVRFSGSVNISFCPSVSSFAPST